MGKVLDKREGRISTGKGKVTTFQWPKSTSTRTRVPPRSRADIDKKKKPQPPPPAGDVWGETQKLPIPGTDTGYDFPPVGGDWWYGGGKTDLPPGFRKLGKSAKGSKTGTSAKSTKPKKPKGSKKFGKV